MQHPRRKYITGINYYSKIFESKQYPTLTTFESVKREYNNYSLFSKKVDDIDFKILQLNGSDTLSINKNVTGYLYVDKFPDNLNY